MQNAPHDIAVRAQLRAAHDKNEPKQSVAEWAAEYMKANPKVYQMFAHFAWEAIMAMPGKVIGARMVWERMRWETDVRGDGEYRLNNNAIPFLAREFMRRNPEVGEVFVTRVGKHTAEVDF